MGVVFQEQASPVPEEAAAMKPARQICSSRHRVPDQHRERIAAMDVVFSGGHETDPRDGGRPVVLVAGAA